jgi:hypothetical protein
MLVERMSGACIEQGECEGCPDEEVLEAGSIDKQQISAPIKE